MNDAQKLLASRIGDYVSRSERGELVCGNFLTPGEIACSIEVIKDLRVSDRVFFAGGYCDAERKRIYVLPSFLSDFEGDAEQKAREYFADDYDSSVKAIKISGSGYRELTHRDFLGSVLALGVERDALGDIVTEENHIAILFCTDKIFPYLMSSIDRVGSDKVTVTEFNVTDDFCSKREFVPIHNTVASERLDCVVCALTNLSREKAQSVIRQGLCDVNYLNEQRCDVSVKPPCTVSLRGYGKYKVVAFDGETKRGRLRIVAQKYV